MENLLEIRDLSKKYEGFYLDKINLSLPKGCIMGFVGENGAGKSTTIKLILNLIHRDSGEIKIFGLDNMKNEKQIKEAMGVVLDESNFPEHMTATNINLVMKNIYQNWDETVFHNYLEKFSLQKKKTIKDYSRGMKMKLAIATALSHHAKLLVLDEATSGLDPFVRDEILDIFLEFIQNEEHAIFISSHIISELEKIADYITLIHKGKVFFSETKNKLLEDYGILKCAHDDFASLDQELLVGYRKNQFGVEALVKRNNFTKNNFKENFAVEQASIEEIMLYHIRGGKK